MSSSVVSSEAHWVSELLKKLPLDYGGGEYIHDDVRELFTCSNVVCGVTLMSCVDRVQRRCGEGCSSGGTVPQDDGGFGNEGVYAMTTYNIHSGKQWKFNLLNMRQYTNCISPVYSSRFKWNWHFDIVHQ
jgi:hypothetical protein